MRLKTQMLRRLGADLAALAVAGVAARATWDHISSVGTRYGESMAVWLPVSIDGMMIAGVILTVDASIMGRPRNPWAFLATWLGGLLSIGAQIESARPRGMVAMIIASVFSIALIISVEAIAFGRKATTPTDTPVDVTDAVPESKDEPTPTVSALLLAPAPQPTPRKRRGRKPGPQQPPSKPRRVSVPGHAGVGASDAEIDAAVAQLSKESSIVPEPDAVPIFSDVADEPVPVR